MNIATWLLCFSSGLTGGAGLSPSDIRVGSLPAGVSVVVRSAGLLALALESEGAGAAGCSAVVEVVVAPSFFAASVLAASVLAASALTALSTGLPSVSASLAVTGADAAAPGLDGTSPAAS